MTAEMIYVGDFRFTNDPQRSSVPSKIIVGPNQRTGAEHDI